jgi:hypothetical protein
VKELTLDETNDVSAGKFRLHFNVFQAIGAMALGFVTAGPVGIGYALCTVVIAQGVGGVHDVAADHYGWQPLQ